LKDSRPPSLGAGAPHLALRRGRALDRGTLGPAGALLAPTLALLAALRALAATLALLAALRAPAATLGPLPVALRALALATVGPLLGRLAVAAGGLLGGGRRGLGRGSGGGRLFRRGCGRGPGAVVEGASGVGFLDAGRVGLHPEAGLLQDGHGLLRGDPPLLRYLVNALLCHS
jgi:hypothetical protein